MYKYPPLVREETLASGSGKVNQLLNRIESALLAVTQTLDPGVAAWRIYDDLTSGGLYDKVFYSSGSHSAGSAAIFVRLFQTTTTALQCRTYSDWSTTDNAGNGQSNSPTLSMDNSASVYYYFNGNEHAFALMISQSVNWNFLYGGETIRDFCHPGMAGRARLASVPSTGSNITISLDQDVSRFLVTGSQGYIVSLTTSGSGLRTMAWSISQITAINGTNITMANVAASHQVGDLFGVFPQSNIIANLTNAGTMNSFAGYTTIGSASAFSLTSFLRQPHQSGYEGVSDPNVYGRFEAMYLGFKDNTTTTPGNYVRNWWGCMYHVLGIANDGNWNLADRIRINNDNDKIFRPFPDCVIGAGGYMMALRDTGSVV